MSDTRYSDVIARYTVKAEPSRLKGAGGVACVAFTALLGFAFWAGALIASTPVMR